MYKKNRRTRRKSIRRVVRKDAIQKSVGKNRRSIRKSVRRKNTSTRKSTRRKSRTKRKSTRRKSRTKRRSVRRGSWANIRKTLWRKNQYGGFVEGFDPLEQGSCSQLGGGDEVLPLEQGSCPQLGGGDEVLPLEQGSCSQLGGLRGKRLARMEALGRIAQRREKQKRQHQPAELEVARVAEGQEQ